LQSSRHRTQTWGKIGADFQFLGCDRGEGHGSAESFIQTDGAKRDEAGKLFAKEHIWRCAATAANRKVWDGLGCAGPFFPVFFR
jgi:hypothetical protein